MRLLEKSENLSFLAQIFFELSQNIIKTRLYIQQQISVCAKNSLNSILRTSEFAAEYILNSTLRTPEFAAEYSLNSTLRTPEFAAE